MSRLALNHPTVSRSAIAAGVAVLAILTVLTAAPDPGGEERPEFAGAPGAMVTDTIPVDPDEQTFAEIFEEMRTPEPETRGGGQEAVEVATVTPQEAAAEPAPTPGGQPVPATLPGVEPVRPALTVRGVDASTAAQIAEVEGVSRAAVAEVGPLTLQVPGEAQTVTVAAIDPVAFRPLTPGITANETAVWQRIIAGDIAFNHDAGNRLPVDLGSDVPAGTTAQSLRVGAYASNGIPPVADGLLSVDKARALGFQGDPEVFVAIDTGANIDQVTQAISALPGAVVELIEEPQEQQAFLTGSAAADFFEPFNYIDHGDGLITIDPGWVERNIVTEDVPIFQGPVTCHRQFVVQLRAALAEVERNGLAHLIDVNDYGGCWVARHIDWSPSRPISMHGWGLAVDFNVQTNQLGARPTMDPRIVEIFDRWGFVWGGRWSRPDGMHFELGAVLTDIPDSAFSTLGQ